MMDCVLYLVLGLLSLNAVLAQLDKVLMSDVKVLTLTKGVYTTARRSLPVPQLQCLSGCGAFNEPISVQCYNRGTDGIRIQWDCKAQLRNNLRFGELRVSCEGYDSSNDPYILIGSCGLKYRLESSQTNTAAISGGAVGGILALAISICGVIFCCKYFAWCPLYQGNRPYVAAPVLPYAAAPGRTIIINNPTPAPYYPRTYPSHYPNSSGGGTTYGATGFANSETR